LIYLRSSGVLHIFGRLLTRVKTLLQTSPQFHVCIKSYGPPKLRESPFQEFQDSQVGSPWQNDIWVQGPWLGTKNTIKEKVVACPKYGLWWVLWIHVANGSLVHQKCSNYALTNLLFSLCRSMWIIDLLVIRSSAHPRVLACPSTFEMLVGRERTPIRYPFVVFTLNP